MADPGFPIGGGVDLVGGGVDSWGSYVSKILCVKTKELGPLGGAHTWHIPLDLPMYRQAGGGPSTERHSCWYCDSFCDCQMVTMVTKLWCVAMFGLLHGTWIIECYLNLATLQRSLKWLIGVWIDTYVFYQSILQKKDLFWSLWIAKFSNGS